MYTNDSTRVYIPPAVTYDKNLKLYKAWLKERNMKFSFVYVPEWNPYPAAIVLRNEDAVMFKLVFGL